MSGGRSIGGDSVPGSFLEYSISIAKAGSYQFLARKFWQHGPFRYRWNGTGDWVTVTDTALLDSVQLDQRCINWVPAGTVQLSAGANTVRIEALEAGKPFVFDCFLVVNAAFTPNGRLKPGEKFKKAQAGMWSFEPDPDQYLVPDALNLRAMNEQVAGGNGYLVVDRQGDVVDGKGQPVRLWAVNTTVQERPLAEVQAHARHFAKRGVNMVRYHSALNPDRNLAGAARESTIDNLHKLVAGMKGEGIYTTWSPYWAGHNDAPKETLLF